MKLIPSTSSGSSLMRSSCLWLAGSLVITAMLTAARPATPNRRCFGPDGGAAVCVEWRLLSFWIQQGGASTFGLPVAPAVVGPGGITVQYFERARLELHPENPAPYDVQLGRIGAESLSSVKQASVLPVNEKVAGPCRTFSETGQVVCGKFLQFWRSHGLHLDRSPRVSEPESLALFGLPLTGARLETGTDGSRLVAQWFERVRLVARADGRVTVWPLGHDMAQGEPQGAAAPAVPAASMPAVAPTDEPSPPAPAQASAPASTLPVAQAPAAPQANPAPVNVPPPGVPCNANVPAPANGFQMWVPQEDGDQMVACVRLIVGGAPANGASVHVDRNYPGETLPALAQSTGLDGVAGFIFYIGAGSPGIPSNLHAVTSFQGVTYEATLALR